MSSYTLFPGITPDSKPDDHIPRYREMDWDQLRVYVSGLAGVSAKQKREEIEADLDDMFEVETLEEYAEEAWHKSLDEYKAEFQ